MQVASTQGHEKNKQHAQECHAVLDDRFKAALDRGFTGDVVVRIHIKQGFILAVTSTEEQRHQLSA